MNQAIKKMVVMIAITLSLQSCIFVVGAAAGAAGAAAVYDHRKLAQVTQDNNLNNRIIDNINAIPDTRDNAHINVTTFNDVVLLTGQAVTQTLRQQIEATTRAMPGVDKVYNQIEVMGPISNLTKASDSWITAKIKTEMLAMKGLKSGSIKVVTENGSVYLMGVVNREQAENAADIARKVSGVQKVVKVFQYTS
jgi:osmotically-inducible protein OsmY